MKTKGIDSHSYMVKDMPRAKAFYRDVMGMTPTLEYDDFVEFDLGDGSTFGLWNPKVMNWEWSRGYGILFAVPDIGEAVAAVRAAGLPMADVQEHQPCSMAIGEDTEGNQLIVHQRKATTA